MAKFKVILVDLNDAEAGIELLGEFEQAHVAAQIAYQHNLTFGFDPELTAMVKRNS